ncbi:MAG: TIGR00730 family Rossman fold protein [Bacteroidales bacterium]
MANNNNNSNDDRIKSAFQQKNWNEIQTSDTWSIFRILSEFVQGFNKLSKIGPCVSIFGSARTKPDNEYFKLAEEIAYKLTQFGYGVITGGGPGIMEAGNMGARKGKGKSVGINIDMPFEQGANLFIDPDKLISFEHFFVRKVMFVKYAQGFIVLPGGFGTLDELFEAITLIQTEKIGKFPIILVGSKFWNGLVDWLKDVVLKEEHNISDEDLELFHVVDTADEAVEHINSFYSQYILSPNF